MSIEAGNEASTVVTVDVAYDFLLVVCRGHVCVLHSFHDVTLHCFSGGLRCGQTEALPRAWRLQVHCVCSRARYKLIRHKASISFWGTRHQSR